MSKEKIDKSELANGCVAAIIMLTALGLSICNYFNTKELGHRLEVTEINLANVVEKLDKYQIEERKYVEVNEGKLNDSDPYLGIVELWEQYKETDDGKLLAEWATQSLYDIIVKQFGTVNDNHEILHTVLRELVKENMAITHEGKEK